MEQQLPTGQAERKISEFVDDDEIVAQQVFRQSARTAGGFFLFELVDEIDEIEEAPPGAGADDRRSHGDAEVGFSRARRDSDMAPGFWRVKRQSTTCFIRLRAKRWRRAVGESCTEAWSALRSVSLTTR